VGWHAPYDVTVCAQVASWIDVPEYRTSALVGLMAFAPEVRIAGIQHIFPDLETGTGRMAAANMMCVTALLAHRRQDFEQAKAVLGGLGASGNMSLQRWSELESDLSVATWGNSGTRGTQGNASE
jgi:hypothetical protein